MWSFVEDQCLSHKQISQFLIQKHPTIRGLSPMSVRRYCQSKGIHKTSRLDDVQLDQAVVSGVAEV